MDLGTGGRGVMVRGRVIFGSMRCSKGGSVGCILVWLVGGLQIGWLGQIYYLGQLVQGLG
jgi:hypothetical protein